MSLRDELMAGKLQPELPGASDPILRNVLQSRLGGKVERCHSIPHHGSYSNAAHSWGVSMLLYYLWPADFARLVIHCLTHDVPEGWVGDVPSTMLNADPEIKALFAKVEKSIQDDLGLPFEGDLPPEDYAKLKACDRLELYIWCCEQVACGNLYALEPMKALHEVFAANPLPAPAQAFFEGLTEVWPLPEQAGIAKYHAEKARA